MISENIGNVLSLKEKNSISQVYVHLGSYNNERLFIRHGET